MRAGQGLPALPPDANPHGKSLAEWAVAYMQWTFRLPVHGPDGSVIYPELEPTGAHCGTAQSGHVWFLPGVLGAARLTRDECVVPRGTMLLVSITYCSGDAVGDPGTSVAELKAFCQGWVDGARNVAIEVDGAQMTLADGVAAYRVQPPAYSFTMPDDNIYQYFGVDAAPRTYAPGIVDGYFLMLHPLSPGRHTIRTRAFGATWGTTYHLTVGS